MSQEIDNCVKALFKYLTDASKEGGILEGVIIAENEIYASIAEQDLPILLVRLNPGQGEFLSRRVGKGIGQVSVTYEVIGVTDKVNGLYSEDDQESISNMGLLERVIKVLDECPTSEKWSMKPEYKIITFGHDLSRYWFILSVSVQSQVFSINGLVPTV